MFHIIGCLFVASASGLQVSSGVYKHPCDGPSHGAEYGFGSEAVRKPETERVALLLRGVSFHKGYRKRKPGCIEEMHASQVLAWQSLMDKIVITLERQHIPVDMFITDREECKMFDDELHVFLDPHRNVKIKRMNTSSQALNMRAALDWFKQEAGGMSAVLDYYSLVIVTRHDLIWLKPFGSWPTADTSKFNFLNREGFSTEKPNGDFQVNDVFHMMPGHAFPAFDWAVGTGGCFNPETNRYEIGSVGHLCMCQLSHAIGSDHISFVTEWRPNHGREDSDVIQWIKPYVPESSDA